jgi:putative FmdB family regulatory protein
MPTYDYVCDSCGHEFEAFESIKAEPQKACPECRDDGLRRKLGPGAAVLFKGSGFYQTDYRSESYKKAAKAESSGSDGAAAKSPASASKTSGDKPSSAAARTTPKTAAGSSP